jgi:hypothetical protein
MRRLSRLLGSFCQKRSLWETLTHGLRQIAARHYVLLIQAASRKPSSKHKPQASSAKLLKVQAASFKPRAASLKLQAASGKLQDLVSFIKFQRLEARDFTRINVFLGCLTWKLIWCGERRTELPLVTFNSTVKKK